jgi:hypothetical protein
LGPPLPPLDRLLDVAIKRGGVRLGRILADKLRRAVAEAEVQAITDPDRDPSAQLVERLLLELAVTPHQQRVVAAGGAEQISPMATDPGPDFAVVESWD